MGPVSNATVQQVPKVDAALIAEIVRRIVDAFHPQRIILFGSRVRGTNHPDSDIDLFVEMESDLPTWDRRRQIEDLFPRRWWSMDLLIYTPEEVAERRNSLISIVPIVEAEGELLYERKAA